MIYIGNEKTRLGKLLEQNSPALLFKIRYRRRKEAADAARIGSLYYLRGFLDDGGVDVNSMIRNGHDSILIASVESGRIEKVKYVIDLGADINGATIDGRNPMIAAAHCGDPDIIHLLARHGADANQCDVLGKTVLMFAASKGHASIVEAVLSIGGNPMMRSRFGHSALDYAIRGERRFKKYLERRRARLETKAATIDEIEALDNNSNDRDYRETKRLLRHALKSPRNLAMKRGMQWKTDPARF